MTNQNQLTYKIIQWVLFGYAVLSIINIVIKILLHFYFHYGLNDGFIEIHFNYYLPLFCFFITSLFSVITFIFIKKKFTKWYNNSPQFYFLWFLILTIAGIVIDPLIQITSDDKLSVLFNNFAKSEYLSLLNFDVIFNTLNYCIIGSKWTLPLFVFILLFFDKKRKTSAT